MRPRHPTSAYLALVTPLILACTCPMMTGCGDAELASQRAMPLDATTTEQGASNDRFLPEPDAHPMADYDMAEMDAGDNADARPDGDSEVMLDDMQMRDARGPAMPDSGASMPDANHWGPCSVMGLPGQCIHLAQCGQGMRSVPGHCPGPQGIQCCVPVGEGFDCDPDEAPPMPAPSPPPAVGDCPAGMVAIEDFCIDRYEAALVGDQGQWSPYHNPGAEPLRAVAALDAIPQGYINGLQASAACERAGKRLCGSVEWLRACQGPDGWTYPYGPSRQPGQCNDSRAVHPAVELFPDAPNPFALIQDACINQLPNGLARTGAYSECVTPEGVHDLMGNLHEWVADASGVFRGGFYVDTVRNGPGCLYRTTAHDRSHWDYSTGFRCCAEPAP
jgi:sulfatase modifying factor 1